MSISPSKNGMPRNILVCGGRDYSNEEHVFRVLDHIHEDHPIRAILNGGASGADTLAFRWAMSREVNCHTFPAKWSVHGKAAGPIRNREMLNILTPNHDGVVAFPGGRGTKHMVAIAKERGFGVLEVT